MPTCRFAFTYKGNQLCILEQNCALILPAERQTCQMVYESFSKLTPEDIEYLKQRLIAKLEQESTT